LGDIVSENSDENENCIQQLKKLKIQTGQGQHDDTCSKCNFPPVSNGSRDFLATLPVMLNFRDILLVHDNPLANAINGNGMWGKGSYILSELDSKVVFDDFIPFRNSIKYVFVGHTHAPNIFSTDEIHQITFGEPIQLRNDQQYIINPGSIGGTPRGEMQVHSYLLFDTELNQIIYFKVDQNDLAFAEDHSSSQVVKPTNNDYSERHIFTPFMDTEKAQISQITPQNDTPTSTPLRCVKNNLIYYIDEKLSVCGYSGISSQVEFSRHGFNAQLQCTDGFDDWLNEILDVKCLPFDDCVQIPLQILESAYEWLSDHWDKNNRILISCAAGESRSVSIAIGLFTLKTGMTLTDACKVCFSAIPPAYPHPQPLISVARYCSCRLKLNELREIYKLILVPPPFLWSENDLIEALAQHSE
jgi:predicted phosphodiesterase